MALFKIDMLVEQLHDIGVERGGVLVVHASFSKLRPVEGGPEELAPVRYRRPKWAMVLHDGVEVRHDYDEIDHCCERFALVDGWLDAEQLQRRGVVGNAEARLARARDIVRVVIARLRQDETAFLHPPGVDVECDDARASLERAQ